MSLLMQALRTAEAKKKQAAGTPAAAPEAPAPAALRPSEGGELTLEVKEPTREDIATAKEMAADAAAAQLQAQSESPSQLQLQNNEPAETVEPVPVPVPVAVAVAAPAAEPVDYFSSEVPPARPTFAPAPPVDATPAPAPAERQLQPDPGAPAAPVSGYETPAMPSALPIPPAPASPLMPAPAPGAGPLGESVKQTGPTVQQQKDARGIAGAVFAAKAGMRNRRPLLLAAAGLLVLGAAGLYGYLQYMRLSAPQGVPYSNQGVLVPNVADATVAPVEVAPVVADPAAATDPAPTFAQPAPASRAAAGAAMPGAGAPALPNRTRAAARERVRESGNPLSDEPADGSGNFSSNAAANPPPRMARAAPSGASTSLRVSEGTSRPIELTRNDGSRRINPTLTDAYQAFVSGDAAAARTQYQQVLQQEPDNRDALLGLAAIAVNRRQSAEAGAFYARLLELDPSDAEAASGLASVQRSDPVQAESNLKKVIAASPQTGSAHFALGNVYAQQQRWAEAQQAYFHALGAVPGNADYAFNLAVSLDKLGQKKLALDAYAKSLQLAQGASSNVNLPTVQTRVAQLRRELAGTP